MLSLLIWPKVIQKAAGTVQPMVCLYFSILAQKLVKVIGNKIVAHLGVHGTPVEKNCSGVNFINLLCTHFSYESLLSSFSLLRIWL